ncbi:MAG: alpha,alpha-trehalase TreF [Bacteroidota bacterium]
MNSTSFFLIERLSPLYEDVQLSEIFPDSKYFVDCVPLHSTGEILSKYEKEKLAAGFDLKTFVQTNFRLPKEANDDYRSGDKSLEKHLSTLWDVLTRTPDEQGGTLIPLPHPYIVPGGRFREVYYWDSYFTMLGLQVSKRVDIIENMINNFAYLIDTVGFIPNGNRTYYLGRSQPPFFAMMLSVLMEEKGTEILDNYQSQLEKEYAFWMDGAENVTGEHPAFRRCVKMPDGTVLNRYWDDYDTPRPEAYIEDRHLAEKSGRNVSEVYRHIRAAAESGWDFSSRWFRDEKNMSTIQTTDLVPVDLNCLLARTEELLCTVYKRNKDEVKLRSMQVQLEKRKKAIQQYCWNEEKGFYFDYHFIDQQPTASYTLAATFPLFMNISGPDQQYKVARIIEEKFLQPGGLLTTLNTTGQQWDAPNGWAPLQWICWGGIVINPNLHKLAEKIQHNWMHSCEKVYAATGKMMEKYNVTDTQSKAGGGEYPNQDGFGWTNGVYLKFLSIEKER